MLGAHAEEQVGHRRVACNRGRDDVFRQDPGFPNQRADQRRDRVFDDFLSEADQSAGLFRIDDPVDDVGAVAGLGVAGRRLRDHLRGGHVDNQRGHRGGPDIDGQSVDGHRSVAARDVQDLRPAVSVVPVDGPDVEVAGPQDVGEEAQRRDRNVRFQSRGLSEAAAEAFVVGEVVAEVRMGQIQILGMVDLPGRHALADAFLPDEAKRLLFLFGDVGDAHLAGHAGLFRNFDGDGACHDILTREGESLRGVLRLQGV